MSRSLLLAVGVCASQASSASTAWLRRAPAFAQLSSPWACPSKRTISSTSLRMKLTTGIVGLPNVGKSTLFNALTESTAAQAANFPFCTIDPNVGIVEVRDKRLKVLEEINKSVKVVPAVLEFVDIAGLVKGASKGEGLGNQFLSNIRECDAIVHVVRCFEDDNVIHVDSNVDPLRDIDVISLELCLADLGQIEKRLQRIAKVGRGEKESTEEKAALERIEAALNEGKPARNVELSEIEEPLIAGLKLLTMKRVIFACNVGDEELAGGNKHVESVGALAEAEGSQCVVVSAQVEAELAGLEPDERNEYLESLGVEEGKCGLSVLVPAAYELLGLQTYFTSGETETRAWTVKKGATAPEAAGVIHTDFQRGFIRAETISYDDLVECGSNKAAKEAGKARSEGKEYIVQEGDIMEFRFNV